MKMVDATTIAIAKDLCSDWDGTPLANEASTRTNVLCGFLRLLVQELEKHIETGVVPASVPFTAPQAPDPSPPLIPGRVTGGAHDDYGLPKTDREVALSDAEQAVITGAKAMRNQLPGSVRMLYDAVDALVGLEKKGNEL